MDDNNCTTIERWGVLARSQGFISHFLARIEGKVLNHRFKKQWLKCDLAEVMTAPVALFPKIEVKKVEYNMIF